jgi:hypothetical protein
MSTRLLGVRVEYEDAPKIQQWVQEMIEKGLEPKVLKFLQNVVSTLMLLQERSEKDIDAFVEAAYKIHACDKFMDDRIEIDNDAMLSTSDEGAYVSAWVWVDNKDAGIESDVEDEDEVLDFDRGEEEQ